MSNNYGWGEGTFDTIAALGVSCNDAHIRNRPLRALYEEVYERMKNRKYEIANDCIEKWRRVQRTYREKRNRELLCHLELHFEVRDPNMI